MLSRSLGILLLLIAPDGDGFAGHSGVITLDSRRAAPDGIQLELIRVNSAAPVNAVKYKLRVIGYPLGITFDIFARDFARSFEEVALGFQASGSEGLIGGVANRVKLEEMTFQPGPYPAGAVWELALVSSDRSIRAFARTVPYPITVRSGSCSVSLELISHLGNRFLASGEGFVRGEEVMTDARYYGRSVEKQVRVSEGGLLPKQLLAHGGGGPDRAARYSVKGRSCEVIVDYQWGEPALIRR